MSAGNIVSAIFGTVVKIVVVAAALIFIYKGSTTCYDYGYRLFTEKPVALGVGRDVTVSVTSDMSALEIGKYFEEQGLTRDAKLFALQYMFSEYKDEVQPGVFKLSTAMTAEEMMAVMAGRGDEDESEDSESVQDELESEEEAEDIETIDLTQE